MLQTRSVIWNRPRGGYFLEQGLGERLTGELANRVTISKQNKDLLTLRGQDFECELPNCDVAVVVGFHDLYPRQSGKRVADDVELSPVAPGVAAVGAGIPPVTHDEGDQHQHYCGEGRE